LHESDSRAMVTESLNPVTATHPNMAVRLPFREAGVDKPGVLDILEASGVGLPDYYKWRSRSGCTFCFFQQKIEWVRLMEEHPDAYEDAPNGGWV